MSDFQELIGSFPKTREYVRDFFVYGFKTRNDFKDKSPRTYDNERRRLESWLAPYVRKDYAADGSNLSLAIDSSLLDTNPLFQVWKTKSFTDNDIVLHFLILDLLRDGRKMTAEEITDGLLAGYEVLFDIQLVRRKCNTYVKEGLLHKEKNGKAVFFFLDDTPSAWISANEAVLDALAFYQMAGIFGIIGNELLEQFDSGNLSFRVKHSFFVHTLEEEILLELLNAMNQKSAVQLEIKSSKQGNANTAHCIPLQIFISTRSGRRFLCGYVLRGRRFTCFRLDSVKRVTLMEKAEEYDELSEKLNRNREKLWGVSFQNDGKHFLDKLSMTLQVLEPSENYILTRLEQEGRGGTVTRTAPNTYLYEVEVFDCNELLPWIRTFTGRILALECSDQSVVRQFYRDLQSMYRIYGIEQE
ncbi:MAG: WYL domain-containing protein [Lachnospiraceae bacterium]|nr:WYL domain-containing protein [Lachnospiraceae bacterium]